MKTTPAVERDRGVIVNVTLTVLSLVVSLYAMYAVDNAQEELEKVELRLVCLEIPGPNDCGADGR
ncbi:hypothetical protein E9549_05225 [Blastococcus sp. MG754426]|uniref:hypothetical protein n=1 Tax=unclassified Blastococcus TaxID=2619396 RepID=UPI001EF04F57|nr:MULTISPECIES: hypothetical protein [unclassified Blastococcus]MCF6506809.1 hypothetical protein [Blastococcus sp. MG754426]MCF6511609.1 hypothetical protein [Blastococcus sp. MG754427]